jgi:hypothetical protein
MDQIAMNAIIFTGPTLSQSVARRELEATYLPPAAQGDVYRAATSRPVAIGIIDGVFDQVPSIWHKEILWAMSQGIHVFGSASMGALRAAELADFGMQGVGEIFRAYQNSTLEDDDEVAVAHGTDKDDFCNLSDAMVNIRQTLLRAEKEGVLTTSVRSNLERIAKELYYPDRSYHRMLEVAGKLGEAVSELEAFRAWLPGGKVDQKREDALEMLRSIRTAISQGLAPKVVDYKLENSVVWNALVNSAGFLHINGEQAEGVTIDDMLTELWSSPDLCLQAYQYAAIRHLVRQAARATGASVSAEKIAAVEAAFRADRDIDQPSDFEQWLDAHHMMADEFAELVQHEALQHESALAPWPFPHRWMIDWLRIRGQFGVIAAAAAAKKTGMDAFASASDLQDPEVATEALLQWYVERMASPDAPGHTSSRATLTYLRKDWEAFLAAIVKRHRSQAAQQVIRE